MATKKDSLGNVSELLFINEGWTQKAIADYLKVTEKTVGRWASDGKWEEKRKLLQTAPHRIKLILLEEFERIARGEETKVDADAISKISKAIREISDKISIEVIMSVFKEFDVWLVEDDPEFAIKSTEKQRKFLLHKINQENG